MEDEVTRENFGLLGDRVGDELEDGDGMCSIGKEVSSWI